MKGGMLVRYLSLLVCLTGFLLVVPNVCAQTSRAPTLDRLQMERYGRAGFRFFLEGVYGVSRVGQRQFTGALPEPGIAEMKWGFGTIEPQKGDYARIDDRFAFGSFMRPAWSPSGASPGAVQGDLWRVGFGIREGYAYWPSGLLIAPTFLWGVNWAHWSPVVPAGLSPGDSAIVARYDRRTCFSVIAEPGLKLQFGWNVSITGGYEFGVLYPRFVVPEWLGSFTLAATTEAVAGLISSGIMKDAPAIAPVVDFILRGGIAYGFYLLWRDNMNWPFPSETPLTVQGYKAGISVRF